MLRLSLGVPRLTAIWVPVQASWGESIRAEWTGRVAARSAATEREVRKAEVRTAWLTKAWLTWRAYVFAATMDRLAHRMSGWRALSSQLELLPAAAAARQALRRRGLERGLRGWVAWRGRREGRANGERDRVKKCVGKGKGDGRDRRKIEGKEKQAPGHDCDDDDDEPLIQVKKIYVCLLAPSNMLLTCCIWACD